MQEQKAVLDAFIIVVAHRSQIILDKIRIYANGRSYPFFVARRLAEDHIYLTEKIIDRRQDELDGTRLGIPFEILNDPDGLHLVLLGKSVLQLEDVVFFTYPYIPLDLA